jgi:septum formation protein
MWRDDLILASASVTRARLLRDAGVAFRIEPSGIDEHQIKRASHAAGADPAACALALAVAKARDVSVRHPGALVIGADQLLVTGTEWLDKPADLAAARAQLQHLRGRTHQLATAVCLVRRDVRLWHHISVPSLTMWDFSDAILDHYIGVEGEALLGSVGAYRIEGGGVQLFTAVAGDHFAILGLPLIELLGFLRQHGMLEG